LPELRKDPITGRWVIIATGRAKRPTDFSRQPAIPSGRTGFCPFCPGNESRTPPEVLAFRPHGNGNSPGWTVRVVPNKFPVLRVEGSLARQGEGMFDRMTGVGAHEVIIETPDHSRPMAELTTGELKDVLWAFRSRVIDLARDKRLRYVVVFKNHGEAAGASLEHPHSQLIALPVIPKRVKEEIDGALLYYRFKERCVYCDIIGQELMSGTRLVSESDQFVVVEPFAPRFPFETWIVPRDHASHFESSSPGTIENLAWALRSTLRKLDRVLEHPAYNFIIHTAPLQDEHLPHFHWHIEIMPRLTKVAGFEWATGFHINPTPPEESAAFLRDADVL
jgi:UDPglucose--hexose-1-phosphate uridylyltransferase